MGGLGTDAEQGPAIVATESAGDAAPRKGDALGDAAVAVHADDGALFERGDPGAALRVDAVQVAVPGAGYP